MCNLESLTNCFFELDGRKALGVDGISKDVYRENLQVNIEHLISKMKTMSYRPGAVREVRIPKEGAPGAFRPLGISNFEDKIVQLMTAKTLAAIYEPVFRDCSYGFRPKRSCHLAIKSLAAYLCVISPIRPGKIPESDHAFSQSDRSAATYFQNLFA